MSQSSDFALNVYLPSKDPRIRDLYRGTFGLPGTAYLYGDRMQKAVSLALEAGLTVQGQIDGAGLDPFGQMSYWKQEGFLTVPKIGDAVVKLATPPGDSAPNIPNYNDTKYSIKVSVDPADYPVFDGPVVADTTYVGAFAGNGLYNAINGAEKVFARGDVHEETLPGGGMFSFTFLPAPALKENFWLIGAKVS
jgi:hypothetical protein